MFIIITSTMIIIVITIIICIITIIVLNIIIFVIFFSIRDFHITTFSQQPNVITAISYIHHKKKKKGKNTQHTIIRQMVIFIIKIVRVQTYG